MNRNPSRILSKLFIVGDTGIIPDPYINHDGKMSGSTVVLVLVDDGDGGASIQVVC